MKRFALPIVLLMSSLLLPLNGEASVKTHILDDCPLALEEVQELSDEERNDLVPYLLSVLRLKVTDLQETPVELPNLPGAPFNSPYSEVLRENILMSFDPVRLGSAKRCAIEVMVLLYPTSVKVLPELIELSAPGERSIQGSEHEIRESLQKVILNIVGRAKNDEKLEDISLRATLAHMLIHHPFPTIEKVLIRIGNVIVPYLISGIEENPEAADRILAVLLAIDPTGASYRQDLLQLISSPDPDIVLPTTLALSTMTEYDGQEILDALLSAARNSPTLTADVIWRVIFSVARQCRPKPLVLTREEVASVMPLLENDGYREGVYDLLSVTEKQHREHYLHALLLYASPHFSSGTRVAALQLLEREKLQSLDAFTLAESAARDGDEDVRVAGISLIGGMSKLGDLPGKELVKLITTENLLHDQEEYHVLLSKAVEALERLPKTKYVLSAFCSLGKMLEWADDTLYTRLRAIFSLYPAEAKGAILPYLTAREGRTRLRATEILVFLRPKEEATLKLLVKLLDDPVLEVRQVAHQYLLKLGNEIVPYLTRALTAPNGKLRLGVAELLVSLSPRNAAALPALKHAFDTSECDEKISYVQRLLALKPAEKQEITRQLVSCIQKGEIGMPHTFVSELAQLSPLTGASLKSIEDVIYYGAPERFSLREELIDHFFRLSGDLKRSVALATTILRQDTPLLKEAAFTLLSERGKLSDEVRVLLEEMSFGVDRHFSRSALRTLILLDPREDYLGRYAELLARDGFNLHLLDHYFPREIVVELLLRLLPKVIDEEARKVVVEALSEREGLKSTRVRELFEEMLYDPREEIRESGAMGLLVSDPTLKNVSEVPAQCLDLESQREPLCISLFCYLGFVEDDATRSLYTESVRSIVCSMEK